MAGKRILCAVLAAMLVLALLPAQARAAGDGVVTYRAIVMYSSNANISESTKNDADNMQAALTGACGYKAENVTVLAVDYTDGNNLSTVEQAITNALSGADADDVSIVYWSGHGAYYSGTDESYLAINNSGYIDKWLGAAELKSATASTQGTVVFLFDCCHSGGLVAKSVPVVTEPESGAFVNGFTSALTVASAVSRGAVGSGETLTGSAKYKVLAAAGYQHYSWGGDQGYFTGKLLLGMGYNMNDKTAALSCPADTNADGALTLRELYVWTFRENSSSLTRCWPEYDDTVLSRYDAAAHPTTGLTASVTPVAAGGNAATALTVRYSTTKPCRVWCEKLYDESSLYETFYNTTETSGVEAGEWLPAGTLNSATGRYEGAATVTRDTSALAQKTYLLRLLPEGTAQQGSCYPVQLLINTGTAWQSNSAAFAVSLYANGVTQTTGSITYPIDNSAELRVRVKFSDDPWDTGKVEQETDSIQPNWATGVTLSAAVLDSAGNTVRTLAENSGAYYILNEVLGKKNYTCNTYNDFFWDGKDETGQYAPGGTYTIRVTGTYYHFSASGTLETATVTKDVSVTSALAAFDVKLYENGQYLWKTVTLHKNTALSEAVTSAPESHNDGWTFAGWSRTAAASSSVEPALVSDSELLTGSTTLYAVYTDGTSWTSSVASSEAAQAYGGSGSSAVCSLNGDGTVQVLFTKGSVTESTVKVLAAGYSGAGKLLEIASGEMTASGVLTLKFSSADVRYYRLFAFDGTLGGALILYKPAEG